jgi:glycerate dehydrogenase
VTNIVVLDGRTINPGDNPWDAIEQFGNLIVYEVSAGDEVVDRGKDAHILITNKCPISADAIERLQSLRFIAVTATGYNVVDVAAARNRDISVSNVPIYGTVNVAQFTWALILELCHRVGNHYESVLNGQWTCSSDFSYWLTPQVELAGKRLGIVGYGRIARHVMAIGHAFGMEVLCCGKRGSAPPPDLKATWMATERLFSDADIVSLHCPLTNETNQIVNRELLARMRSTSFLINTSRGALIDEKALADALNSGGIAGAAVDVVSQEPIRANNPLLTTQNCIITPHIAWSSLAARERLMQATASNIAAFLNRTPVNLVN